MPKTYYDSELTAAEIESVLQAIHDVVSPSNNGKILGIESGRFVAKSASEYSGDAVLEPLNVTANGDYYPSSGTDGFDEVHVNVSGGGGAVVQPLNVTQNGTYNPSSGVDGYAPVTVNVQGGGGAGPVYSGTSAPSFSLGSNEDLYIQYEAVSGADHTYRIVEEYRKVNGVWTQYTIPEMSGQGVHIWTQNTGGLDAAMYVQPGYWDAEDNVFITTGDAEVVSYKNIRSWDTAKDCNGVALLGYPSNWQIKASTTVTDGTNTYQADAIVAQWGYSTSKDIYVYKPL